MLNAAACTTLNLAGGALADGVAGVKPRRLTNGHCCIRSSIKSLQCLKRLMHSKVCKSPGLMGAIDSNQSLCIMQLRPA